MRKIFFAIFMLLFSTVIMAQDGTTPVEIKGESVSGHNRSGIYLPVVMYSSNLNTLTVEFESEDSYVLEIEDTNGITWYTGPLNTTGIPAVYYVNLQSNNTYFITISSANYSFYGILEL